MPKNWHTLDPKKRAPIEFYIRKKEEKDARIANSVNIYNNFKANQAAKAQGLVGFGTFKTFNGPSASDRLDMEKHRVSGIQQALEALTTVIGDSIANPHTRTKAY